MAGIEGLIAAFDAEEKENWDSGRARKNATWAAGKGAGRVLGGEAGKAKQVADATNQGSTQAALEPYREPLSGLNVAAPSVPLAVAQESASKGRFVPLGELGKAGGGSKESCATIGVVVARSKPRQTRTGRSTYSMWTLADKQGAEVRLLLFGEAHSAWWKCEAEGYVVGVRDFSTLQQQQQQSAKKEAVSISVSSADQAWRLGRSDEVAQCDAIKRGGERCTKAVVSPAVYCDFHAPRAAKEAKRKRPESLAPERMLSCARAQGSGAGRKQLVGAAKAAAGRLEAQPKAVQLEQAVDEEEVAGKLAKRAREEPPTDPNGTRYQPATLSLKVAGRQGVASGGKSARQRENKGGFAEMMHGKLPEKAPAKRAHDDEIERRLNELSKREKLQEQAAGTQSIAVRAFRCRECSTLSQSRPRACEEVGHSVHPERAKKRFFSCRQCGWRASSLNARLPREACQCGESDWERAGMASSSSRAPVDPSTVHGDGPGVALPEKLLPRGPEQPAAARHL